jgi:hypothetical protein
MWPDAEGQRRSGSECKKRASRAVFLQNQSIVPSKFSLPARLAAHYVKKTGTLGLMEGP